MRIISGGQTGVDRGALDAAIAHGIPHGGACPLGRKAEDGRIPACYDLTELETPSYPARTAVNVKNGTGTLLLVHGRAALARSRGTKLTLDFCLRYGRPWWAADPRREDHVGRVVEWLKSLPVDGELVLNVAGPRETRARGIQRETEIFVGRVVERFS